MSDKRSISGIIGKGSLRHNNRDFFAANVNRDRTKNNIILCRQDIRDAYHKLFDEALSEYNAKQKRKDRCIFDYYEHIRTSKQEKPFYEVIFQIGDMNDTPSGTAESDRAAAILNEFYGEFQKNNPHIHVFNAVIHMDEATPHIHIDFIPVATESKRGLSTRNSLSKALEQQGFKSDGKFNTCTKLWIDSEKEHLAECMSRHGIEHDVKGVHRSNLSVEEFKLQERMKEVAEIEDKIAGKSAELSAMDCKIETKQAEFEILSEKEVKISDIDKIQIENVIFSDKVKIKKDDYQALKDTSKKYYAGRDTNNLLKARIALLEAQNTSLQQTVSEQSEELNELRGVRAVIFRLENEVQKLRRLIDKLFEFLDKFNLREKWGMFVGDSKKHSKGTER